MKNPSARDGFFRKIETLFYFFTKRVGSFELKVEKTAE